MRRSVSDGGGRGRGRGRAALLVLALAAGCGAAPAPPVASPPRRIVALAPSVTELVFALGAGDRVVGVCGQCDYPAEAARLPRVGGYLNPSVEAVLAARPDLVLAVPSPGNREAVRTIERAGVRVLVAEDRTLDRLWASVHALGVALGTEAVAAGLVADIQARLGAVRARVAAVPSRRVLLVVGHSPLTVAGPGTLQDELLAIAGATNVAQDAGAPWPQLSLEVVIARAPEVIVDAAMGTEAGSQALFAGLATVPAVRYGRVVPLAPDALFRAGPRVADAATALARAIHPEAFALAGPG
ncbi:MAG: helical backbone metal receptor [Candidatus Binatia bacterium]